MTGQIMPEEVRQQMELAYRKYAWLFRVAGILFILAGLAAIALPHIATFAAEQFLGWLLLLTGLVGLGNSVFGRQHPGFMWNALAGLIGIAAGLLLLLYPLQGAITLTLILSIFFLVEGLAKLVSGLASRHAAGWGWMVVSGLCAVILAVLIWSDLAESAAWVLGLLVGINFVIFGIAILATGHLIRRVTTH